MKKKKWIFLASIAFIIFLFALLSPPLIPEKSKEYGVFLGINRGEISKLDEYQLVVIEPTEFTKEDINILHAEGKKVYAYLNIGAIEDYRPYYEDFEDISLSEYENWEDERWVDVSSKDWQQFILDDLAKNYIEMGFDGFFLDNADVYYHYPTEESFEGLLNILKGLREYDVKLIINGGDVFVKRCIQENVHNLFDGVNQETVFTRIDFDKKKYYKREKSDTEYLKDYLSVVKENNLAVYLLEYGADEELEKVISDYCKENGFIYYNAEGLDLK